MVLLEKARGLLKESSTATVGQPQVVRKTTITTGGSRRVDLPDGGREGILEAIVDCWKGRGRETFVRAGVKIEKA